MLSLNTNVTNNRNFSQGSFVSDAVLVINENNAQKPNVESVLGGPDPRFPLPQFGVLAAANRLEWNGVLFPIPGVEKFPSTTLLRITNIRGNPSLLGPSEGGQSSNSVSAFVSITGQASIPVTNNVLSLGVPSPAADVEYRDGANQGPAGVVTTLQCESQNITQGPFGGGFNGLPTFHIRVSEKFPSALRILGGPSFNTPPGAWEAGYFAPGSGANNGGASQGSRVLARFFNIPQGIRLAVPSQVGTGGLVLRLVEGANSLGAGGILIDGSGLQELSTGDGFAFAVYEVITGNPGSQDLVDIPVVVGYIADVENGLPSTKQTMQASATLAPVSSIQTSNGLAPEPRFADASGDPVSIFRVVPCGGGGSQEPVMITTASPLPPTSVGASYNTILQAAGGEPPYSWSLNSPFNPLPPGLRLSSAGIISGSPSAPGNYSVAVRVTATEGTAVAKTFDIVVNEALTILTISPLPAARVQEPYGGTFLAAGGVPPYTWAIVGGGFPNGLNFDTKTGTISGILTDAGTAIFTVRVSDSMGTVFDKEFSLTASQGPPPVVITETPLPTGEAGSSYTTRLDAEQGVQPYTWSIIAGALPPGLALDGASGEISGTPDLPGLFRLTALVEDSAGLAGLKRFQLPIDAAAGEPPRLSVYPRRLLASFVRRSRPKRVAVLVSNLGAGPLSFNVSFATRTGADWLSVSVPDNDTSATEPAAFFVMIDPSGAGPGTYFGRIAVSSASATDPTLIPVVMAVSRRGQLLRLSRKGLTFTAVAGGSVPAKGLRVINEGAGTMNWSISTTTVSEDSDWLVADPPNGSAGPQSGTPVQIKVNPEGLPPGVHYGLLRVSSPEAAGSPRFATVALNLLPAGSNPGLFVDPVGLLFGGEAGGSPPGSKTVRLTNSSGISIPFSSTGLTEDGNDWFTHTPTEGIVEPGQPVSIVVQARTDGLAPGTYRGFIRLTFAGQVTRTVKLGLLLQGTADAISPLSPVSQGSCTPTTLIPELTSNSEGVPISAGWPASIGVTVLDDCQKPMVDGTVTATFTNGHPPLALEHANEGRWSESVSFSSSETGTAVVTISAFAPAGGATPIEGQITRSLDVLPNPDGPPVLTADGVVHAASFEGQPLAAGTIFSLFGEGLSERKIVLDQPFGGGELAQSLPLSSELGGTRIIFAGKGAAPLLFSREDQVNAISPYGLDANQERDIYVQRGNTLSSVVSVQTSQVRPAVFTQFGAGIGPASIQTIKDGQVVVVNQNNPVSAGDVLIIFCAGLGEVDPPILDGHASCEPDGVCLADGSNLTLRSATSRPSVTVGGVQIPDGQLFFAGLSPSFAGLYQINATLPEGITPGDAEIKISFDGFESPDGVTIRVQ